ncbi:MAG: hypothetical protein KGO83_01445 [Paenibacillaceae bacterium]|jgi:stage III sporulation protein AG|nr:hypothetical protein [Paenibacillaceae bacterium]
MQQTLWQKIQRLMTKQTSLLFLAVMGVALIVANGFMSAPPSVPTNSAPAWGTQPPQQQEGQFAVIEHEVAQDARRMIEQIVGVGIVDVLVTVESTPPVTTDRNISKTSQTTQERDKQGATRQMTQSSTTEQSVSKPAQDGTTPAIARVQRPTVRGVLVVAEGVEDKRVSALVHQALHKGLGIASHRIAIVPAKRHPSQGGVQ